MKKENIFEIIIEKYRLWIGGVLILAIVGGSAVLIWRENYKMPSVDGRIKNLESRIMEMEQERNKLQETSVQTNSTPPAGGQNSNVQAEQGTVAGTTSNSAIQQSSNSSAAKPISGKININTASATELDSLSGVGPVTAKNIIDYRTQKGPFKTVDELDNVTGIGQKTIDKFRDQISCQ